MEYVQCTLYIVSRVTSDSASKISIDHSLATNKNERKENDRKIAKLSVRSMVYDVGDEICTINQFDPTQAYTTSRIYTHLPFY